MYLIRRIELIVEQVFQEFLFNKKGKHRTTPKVKIYCVKKNKKYFLVLNPTEKHIVIL